MAMANKVAVMIVHTGRHQRRWQWQWQSQLHVYFGCRCHRKWVSNPFHDVAVDVTFAIAVAITQCEHPHCIQLDPFMNEVAVAVAVTQCEQAFISFPV